MFPFIFLILAVNAAALAVVGLSISKGKYSRVVSVGACVFSLLLTIVMVYVIIHTGMPYTESYGSLPYLGLTFSFTVSGISAALVLMAEIVLLSAAIGGNTEKEGIKLSSAMIVLFEIAAVGLFTSSNLLLFFVFWDIGVVALFMMINVLGSPNRTSASFNFLIYEIFASSMLLLGILILYVYSPAHSLNISYLTSIASSLSANVQTAVFLLFFAAFMTNMPIFPMHFWLPDAHTEASTQGSMILSGILTKFGGYGMLVLFAMMPIASSYSTYIAALAAFSAIYGAVIMLKQTDMKRVIAYSTIVEMGIILFAISAHNSLGTTGAVYGMVSHGIVISLAFLAVGMVKHIFGERNTKTLSGISFGSKTATYAFIIGFIAMIGFPFTSGFIADILVFLGALQSYGYFALVPIASIFIMGACIYGIVSKCFLSTSELSKPKNYSGPSHKFSAAILVSAIIILGVLPFALLNLIRI